MSKKGLQTHQGFLRKLIRDERLLPSRRMLAEMLLLALEERIPMSLVEAVYGKGIRVQWNERGENEVPNNDVHSKDAERILRELYGETVGGDNAGNTTSNS